MTNDTRLNQSSLSNADTNSVTSQDQKQNVAIEMSQKPGRRVANPETRTVYSLVTLIT